MKKILLVTLYLYLILTLAGCSGYHPFVTPLTVPDDNHPVPEPNFRRAPNDFADGFNQQFVLQGEQFTDLSRHIRNLNGSPKEAHNVDAFGEVPNSTWFTNRNATRQMSIAKIVSGPDQGSGPDTASTWTIVHAKAEGVTPGFTIIDGRGEKYVIKFDPVGYAGLNSGSEVIGSRLFYAAGYNVPENYISWFDPRILKLGDKVKFTDEKGRSRYMNDSDLAAMLTQIEALPDGLIRATASKYLPGKPLGPFRYKSRRKDDPNDFIKHQHRRELRGLRVMAAWLNHIDSKAANSMDTYMGEDGQGHVVHYLIDFGTILGSGGRGPQPIYRGYENELDPKALFFRIITLGLYSPRWERVPQEVQYPCIGRYTSEFYHPQKFKIIFPNPAYDNLTSQDGYWGAKLVMSFTDEQLQAVVEQAQYPDPEAADYLLKTLIERRDMTGKYWFKRVCPLDNFEIQSNADGKQSIIFEDLAVKSGLEEADRSSYRYRVKVNGVTIVDDRELGHQTNFELPDMMYQLKVTGEPEQWEIHLQIIRGGDKKYGKWVKLFLERNGEEFQLIGIKRQG